MAEYIKREDALKFPFANGIYDHEHANEHFISGCESYREWLEQIPAADVVEVVRCKDCIYFPSGDDNGENRGFSLEWPHDDWPEDNPCPCKCDDGWYSIKPTPEFYCAYGKRG